MDASIDSLNFTHTCDLSRKKDTTVFMLIERMIQLPQENAIPGIVCILLERKLLSVIIFYESN